MTTYPISPPRPFKCVFCGGKTYGIECGPIHLRAHAICIANRRDDIEEVWAYMARLERETVARRAGD